MVRYLFLSISIVFPLVSYLFAGVQLEPDIENTLTKVVGFDGRQTGKIGGIKTAFYLGNSLESMGYRLESELGISTDAKLLKNRLFSLGFPGSLRHMGRNSIKLDGKKYKLRVYRKSVVLPDERKIRFKKLVVSQQATPVSRTVLATMFGSTVTESEPPKIKPAESFEGDADTLFDTCHAVDLKKVPSAIERGLAYYPSSVVDRTVAGAMLRGAYCIILWHSDGLPIRVYSDFDLFRFPLPVYIATKKATRLLAKKLKAKKGKEPASFFGGSFVYKAHYKPYRGYNVYTRLNETQPKNGTVYFVSFFDGMGRGTAHYSPERKKLHPGAAQHAASVTLTLKLAQDLKKNENNVVRTYLDKMNYGIGFAFVDGYYRRGLGLEVLLKSSEPNDRFVVLAAIGNKSRLYGGCPPPSSLPFHNGLPLNTALDWAVNLRPATAGEPDGSNSKTDVPWSDKALLENIEWPAMTKNCGGRRLFYLGGSELDLFSQDKLSELHTVRVQYVGAVLMGKGGLRLMKLLKNLNLTAKK